MKNLRTIILSAMVAGVLIVPGTSARADAKDEKDHHHFRKHDHDGKWKGPHGKRDGHHDRHDKNYRHDVRHDNRGHHNKPEIRQDFKDVRNARNEVKEGRKELRGDHQELRKDRAELRRDIRNGASKEEILRTAKRSAMT